MILDNEQQRKLLLHLIDNTTFPGSARRQVTALADAIERASLDNRSTAPIGDHGEPEGLSSSAA